MIIAMLLQALSLVAPSVTLSEARAMSPSDLAARLLPEKDHGPVVDAIVNGRGGLTPPSQIVDRIWLVEQMVPFDTTICRSHVFNIEMGSDDPAAKPWLNPVPTHPVKVEQYDRLWVPPAGRATVATCAAAPAQASGFSHSGLDLREASNLVEQARSAFSSTGLHRKFTVYCRGQRDACGKDSKMTLAALDWSSLGMVELVTQKGEPYSLGDPNPVEGAPGSHVQFTFPYAAKGATWVITVDRAPDIKAVRMEAHTIIYE
ncbi:hypothetical protein [Sphingomonas oryzagri]